MGIDGDVGRAASAYSTMICITIFGVFWIDVLVSLIFDDAFDHHGHIALLPKHA